MHASTMSARFGGHLTHATRNRKAPRFADAMKRIAAAFPKAKTIHVVMDNLNTHGEKSLIDAHGTFEGRRLWRRFTAHACAGDQVTQSRTVGSSRRRARKTSIATCAAQPTSCTECRGSLPHTRGSQTVSSPRLGSPGGAPCPLRLFLGSSFPWSDWWGATFVWTRPERDGASVCGRLTPCRASGPLESCQACCHSPRSPLGHLASTCVHS